MASLLLVEDEPDLRELVAEVLDTCGHVTTSAEDGAVAISALNTGAFDVVITDANLPGKISGVELASMIHLRSPNTVVILVSGSAPSELPALPEYVIFLAKPYRVQQLLDLVAQA